MPITNINVQQISASNQTFTGTVRITGGANITVGTDASGLSIVGAAAAGGGVAVAATDTTYTSGTVNISGENRITVHSSTAGGGVQNVLISGPAAQSGISGIVGSDATYTTGTVQFSGENNITVHSSTAGAGVQKVLISGPNTSAQQTGISSIAVSNTTYTSGMVVFTGSNMITAKSSGAGQTVILDATQSAQTQSNIQGIAGTNTTYNTGTVEFTGSNMITVKSSANQRFVIDATQSVQTQNNVDVTLSGNSTSGGAGYALVSSGTLSLAGGPNITLSQDGNKISISAPAPGAGGGIAAAGSNTTYTSGTVEWAGENNITVHSSTAGAGVQKILISGPNTSAQQTGISSIAASNTTYTSGQVVFTGSNMVTVKSSGAGQTVILDATQTVQTQPAPPTVAAWQNFPLPLASANWTITTLSAVPTFWNEVIPGNMTLNSVAVHLSNIATGTLQSFTMMFGLYTLANSTSANLVGSASDQFILSTGSSASWSGQRDFVMTSPGTVAAISNITGGNYILGINFSVGGGGTGSMNQALYCANASSVVPLGILTPGSNNASTGNSQGVKYLNGIFSASSAAMPANVRRQDMNNQQTSFRTGVQPWILLAS